MIHPGAKEWTGARETFSSSQYTNVFLTMAPKVNIGIEQPIEQSIEQCIEHFIRYQSNNVIAIAINAPKKCKVRRFVIVTHVKWKIER